jgi:uncharacterized membrane protein (UPF0127 family)
MLTNARRREILNNVRSSGYPGSISEVFQAAAGGRDLVQEFQMQQQQQQQMQVANTQEEQATGLKEQHAQGNTQASMAFPDVQPNQSFNTVGMKAPIDIQKIDDQGHLVESYKNVPPGIQDLPTGPAEGTIIESPAAYQKGGLRRKRGYVQKYQTAGFDMSGFNMEPVTSVQDNVLTPQVLQIQNENKDFKEKEALLTKIAKDKKIADNQIAMDKSKGTLVNTTKRNAANILGNSMLVNQTAGGYGGSNLRKSIAANPDKTEEIYKNTMRSSGQTTMKNLALATLLPGAGGANTYAGHMTSGINTMNKASHARPFLKGAFQTGYNAMKLGALPTFYNQTGNFGVDLATGNYNNLQKRTMDFSRGIVSTVPALRTVKDAYKMGQDAWEGNYADVLTRGIALGTRSPGIGKGMEYYGTKVGGKFIPESWQNLGGLPSIKSVFNKYTNLKSTSADKVPLIKAG